MKERLLILKNIIPVLVAIIICTCTSVTAYATENSKYEAITINPKSLNGSTIWGVGDTSFTMDNDGGFFSTDKQSDGALPDNGKITTSDKVPYQLTWSGTKNYSGNDSIRLQGKKSGGSVTSDIHTMTLLSYGAYKKIYVLGTAGGFSDNDKSLNFSVTLTYTDGTTSTKTYNLYDWYKDINSIGGNGYIVFKRLNNNGSTIDRDFGKNGGPIMQSKAIDCDATKLLKSVSFQIANTEASVANELGIYAAIYAVTGEIPSGAPSAPTASVPMNKETSGENVSLTASWTSVDGANSYRIDVSEYPGFHDESGSPSFVGDYNNKTINSTSCTISGLNKNKTYYYRVRAVNSYGQSASSNVVMINLPQWVLDAGLTEQDVVYDVKTGKLELKKDIVLTKSLNIPGNSNVTIDLKGYTIAGPSGDAAIKASGKNISLKITNTSESGKSKIIGANGTAVKSGSPAIDFSNTNGNCSISLDKVTIKGGDGYTGTGESESGNSGGDAIKGASGLDISVGSSSGNTYIIGGNGGNADYTNGTGNGGNGGAGISGNNIKITISKDNASGETIVSGGSGGNSNGTGKAGNGGTAVNATTVTVEGNNDNVKVTGGNGGNGKNPGNGGAAGTSYGLNGESGSTHEHKWIKDEQVAPTCTKTGLTEGKHCSICGKVLIAQTEIPALGHDWSGAWVVTKEASATTEGTKAKTCKHEGCGVKQYVDIPKLGADDNTSLEKTAEVAVDVPIKEVIFKNNKTELLEASGIFNENEKNLIKSGTTAKVWVEVDKTDESNISNTDKAAIIEATKEIIDENAAITYFDVDLYQSVNNSSAKKITEPGIAIKVTIKIPDLLLNNNSMLIRNYKIIRLHNSEVSILDGSFDSATNEFTFTTDKFSTYAIIYMDQPISSGGNGNSGGSIGGNGNNTGDNIVNDTNNDDNSANDIGNNSKNDINVDKENRVNNGDGNNSAVDTIIQENDGNTYDSIIGADRGEAPQTGDESGLARWFVLAILSMIIINILALINIKNDRKSKYTC